MTIEQKVLNILTKRGINAQDAEKMIAENMQFCISGYEGCKPSFIATYVSTVQS